MIRYNPSAQYNGISDTRIAVLSVFAIVIAFAAFGLLGTIHLITGYFSAPLILDEQMLVQTTPRNLPFFKAQIKGDRILDSGLSESAYDFTGKIDGTTRYFSFLRVGEHILIVKTRGQSQTMEYSGVVTHVSDDSSTLDIYNGYTAKDPSLKNTLVPLVLDTDYDVSPWFAGLAFEVALLLAGSAGLAIVWRRRFDV